MLWQPLRVSRNPYCLTACLHLASQHEMCISSPGAARLTLPAHQPAQPCRTGVDFATEPSEVAKPTAVYVLPAGAALQ